MATNWVTVAGLDLLEVVSLEAVLQTNANVTAATVPGDETDLNGPNRRDLVLAAVVQEVRTVIQAAGRVPVSATAATVPPDGRRQALVMAAYRLVASTPSLARSLLIQEPGGGPPPLKEEYEEAKLWLYGRPGDRLNPGIKGGANVTYPTDPVGVDGVTAATDADGANPLYQAVRFGSVGTQDQVDLVPFAQSTTT